MAAMLLIFYVPVWVFAYRSQLTQVNELKALDNGEGQPPEKAARLEERSS
jgi:hypothetical protein